MARGGGGGGGGGSGGAEAVERRVRTMALFHALRVLVLLLAFLVVVSSRSYYDVLGVSKSASESQVITARV